MSAPDPRRRRADAGLDESRDYLGEALARFVPQALARRALSVDVTTDRERYRRGTPVELRIEFENRLPVPVNVRTPRPPLWEWQVDGNPAASDERRYLPDHPGQFEFAGGERKVVDLTWDGQVQTDGTWSPAAPGRHEITVFVATEAERPRATTRIEIVE